MQNSRLALRPAASMLAKNWRSRCQLIFDMAHRGERGALCLAIAGRGSEGDKRLLAQTVELHGAELCRFKSSDEFHVILLWLQGGPEPLRAFRPSLTIIIGQ